MRGRVRRAPGGGAFWGVRTIEPSDFEFLRAGDCVSRVHTFTGSFVVVVVLALDVMLGCALHSQDIATPPASEQLSEASTQLATVTASADDHVATAQNAVSTGAGIVKGVPAAAAALPPLGTAANELKAARIDLRTARDNAADIKSKGDKAAAEAKALAGKAADADASRARAEADAAAEKKRYEGAWIGGRTVFWIRVIIGALSTLFVASFVAEFFFGLNIHPLSWIVMAAPIVAKAATNFVKGGWGEASTIGKYLAGLASKVLRRNPSPPTK